MEKKEFIFAEHPGGRSKKIYLEAIQPLVAVRPEKIPVTDALNRVTISAVYAKYCSPLFNAAAMDGIAVISQRTQKPQRGHPLF